MKKNKSNVILTIVIAIFLVIISFIAIYFISNRDDLKKISYSEFKSLISSNKYTIVYYGQEDCGACKAVFPIVKEKSRELDIEVLFLDADCIENSNELEKLNIKYAPSLIVLDNGDVRVYDDINANNVGNILLESENSIIDRPNKLTEISYEDLMKRLSLNYDIILYIGREDCRDCEKFHPIIEEYIDKENNAGAYYFSVKSFRDKSIADDASEEDIAFYDNLKKKFDIQWVPSVYHIINGKIISKYEFLSKEYYAIDDENERNNEEKKFIDDFYIWYKSESQIVKN